MDNKVYVWLFNNINRYEFRDQDANQIKASISRLLITEETINTKDILTKTQKLYTQFCGLFYNNIIGYQNGLATKSITASELDCYFLQTAEGMVPIGYYKTIRPVEAVTMMQKYLEQCQKDANSDRNQRIVKWQNSIDEISQKYQLIKDTKNPSIIRVILGSVSSLALAVLSVISFGKINVIFMICAIALAVAGVLFTLREVKLLAAKKTTKSILNNILPYVTKLEQGVKASLANDSPILFEAARRGENAKVTVAENSKLILNVEKQIKIAEEFVAKSERQRTGISYVFIVILLLVAAMVPLSYSQIVADGIAKLQTNTATNDDDESTETSESDEQTEEESEEEIEEEVEEEIEEEPEKIPKVSSYAVYPSDATWTDANMYAQQAGGYLVSINSREEFDLVCQKADEQNLKVFWVGASKSTYDSWEDAKWNDGEDIIFTNWLQGEPTYYSEEGLEENYLMVFKVKGIWYFNDAINDVSEFYSGKMGYVVETEE